MFVNLVLILLVLYQYNVSATTDAWIDPISNNFTNFWEIVVTPHYKPDTPISVLYNKCAYVVNQYISTISDGSSTNFQWSIDQQTLLNNEWVPITLYTASDSNFVLSNETIASDTVNFTITPTLLTTSYNTTCASGVLNAFGFTGGTTSNATTNLLNTNDPETCLITNSGFSPCDDDDDCADGLACNANFLIGYSMNSYLDNKVFLPNKWCTAPLYPKPYSVITITTSINMDISDNFTETMGLFNYDMSILISSTTIECGTVPAMSLVNTSNLFDSSLSEVFMSFRFMNPSLYCLAQFSNSPSLSTYMVTLSPPVSHVCANNLTLVSNKIIDAPQYSLPSLVNYEYDCYYPAGGLSQCEVTNDCVSGLECALFSAFSNNDTLKDIKVCQTGPVVSNMYNFNISIVPSDDNDHPTDLSVNYIYLQKAKNLIDEHLLINDCLFADSVVKFYIPDESPYQSASYFVYHLNESQICTEVLDIFPLTDYYQSSSQFSTYITPVPFSDVNLQDCINGFGEIIVGSDNCSATASASETSAVTECTTNADCNSPQVCQEVTSDGDSYHICLDTVNLVKYTISIAESYDSITEITELVIDWIKDNKCWSNSTVFSKYFPLQAPYTTGYIYATNAVTSGSCAYDLNPSFIGLGGSVSVTELTNNFDVSTCVVDDQLLCKPSSCSQYIQCDNGLFSECSGNSTCTAYNSTFYCNKEYSVCEVVSMSTDNDNAAYTIHTSIMIIFTILSIVFFF